MQKNILTKKELALFNRLNTPEKIQSYVNDIPFNFSLRGDTLYSPRTMVQKHTAQCLEGALFAAAVLWYHGQKPLLLDLRSKKGDDDHVVALFRKGKYWGAISKTNHAVLRYRDPVYRNVRELAMSYVHEYFLNSNGKKTLQDASQPFSMARYGTYWITSTEHLWNIAEDLDDSPHTPLIPRGTILRPADLVERQAGSITQWKRKK